MYKAKIVLLAFALFVVVEAAPMPCDECEEDSSFPGKTLSHGGPHRLGPFTSVMKTLEDTIDQGLENIYNTFSGAAAGGNHKPPALNSKDIKMENPAAKSKTVVVPVVATSADSGKSDGGSSDCDEC